MKENQTSNIFTFAVFAMALCINILCLHKVNKLTNNTSQIVQQEELEFSDYKVYIFGDGRYMTKEYDNGNTKLYKLTRFYDISSKELIKERYDYNKLSVKQSREIYKTK